VSPGKRYFGDICAYTRDCAMPPLRLHVSPVIYPSCNSLASLQEWNDSSDTCQNSIGRPYESPLRGDPARVLTAGGMAFGTLLDRSDFATLSRATKIRNDAASVLLVRAETNILLSSNVCFFNQWLKTKKGLSVWMEKCCLDVVLMSL